MSKKWFELDTNLLWMGSGNSVMMSPTDMIATDTSITMWIQPIMSQCFNVISICDLTQLQ